MVVARQSPVSSEKISATQLPIIDLMEERSEVSKMVVKACETFGFFKLINHGVPEDVIAKMEEQSYQFFAKSSTEKEQAGPYNPYGYGCKNIGFNGDVGEVEYLMLDANPVSLISHDTYQTISNDPITFSSAVRSYVEAVRELACEILDLIAEGLGVPDTSVLSRLIRDVESDSLLRLNHYPPLKEDHRDTNSTNTIRIGIGEHTDPQILTILRSNDVGGLQISLEEGVWVPVTPHPTAFFVNVGDVLQAMTNGRFLSVKHRAMVNWPYNKSRMSMGYFGSPPLSASISPIPQLETPQCPRLYRSFTWAEYKQATYSRRLGDTRLDFFRVQPNEEIGQ
ncbi:hypothetical protein ACH5RR_030977 [Cinchona calisaya]|uniref:gibberellin 2beta-dioxygenase n=1 Tax=Cinchona calisaya TaxID=153742 RepID=A0ABD2YE24_9GENT